jgi:hypothetical protein
LLRCHFDPVCWDVYAGAVVTPLALAYGWRFYYSPLLTNSLANNNPI